MIEKSIEVLNDENVRLTVKHIYNGKIRSLQVFNLAKLPQQDAEEVCRLVCPEAFPDNSVSNNESN